MAAASSPAASLPAADDGEAVPGVRDSSNEAAPEERDSSEESGGGDLWLNEHPLVVRYVSLACGLTSLLLVGYVTHRTTIRGHHSSGDLLSAVQGQRGALLKRRQTLRGKVVALPLKEEESAVPYILFGFHHRPWLRRALLVDVLWKQRTLIPPEEVIACRLYGVGVGPGASMGASGAADADTAAGTGAHEPRDGQDIEQQSHVSATRLWLRRELYGKTVTLEPLDVYTPTDVAEVVQARALCAEDPKTLGVVVGRVRCKPSTTSADSWWRKMQAMLGRQEDVGLRMVQAGLGAPYLEALTENASHAVLHERQDERYMHRVQQLLEEAEAAARARRDELRNPSLLRRLWQTCFGLASSAGSALAKRRRRRQRQRAKKEQQSRSRDD